MAVEITSDYEITVLTEEVADLMTVSLQVKAMRFPPKSYNKELESAEDRREREAQVLIQLLLASLLQTSFLPPYLLPLFFLLASCSLSPLQDLELAKEMAEDDDDAY